MIIKTSFKDNDFTQVLEDYWGNGLYSRLLDYEIALLDKAEEYGYGTEEFQRYMKQAKQFINLKDTIINKVSDLDVDPYLLKDMKRVITESILSFIEDEEPRNYEYLEKHLEVKIMKSFTPKWENGESVYYIPISDKYLTM